MEPLRNGEDSRALVFEGVHDAFIGRQIGRATERVLLAAPGIREKTAGAFVDAAGRLGVDRVELVVDCDEKVARLGLGDAPSLQTVMDAGIPVRHAPGLRLGVLICDDAAWVFSPTALVVSAEVHSSETPNAIALSPEEARRIALRVSRSRRDEGEEAQVRRIPPELGIQTVSREQLANTQRALQELPPRDFDVTRQVRVFEAYVELVEMTLEGFEFKRRKVRLPPHLVAAADDEEVAGRLSTTFEPIQALQDDDLKGLKDEFNWIRDQFTGVVAPHGRVILRRRKAAFQEAIQALTERIDTVRQAAKGKLADEISNARDGLLGHLERNQNVQPPLWQRRYFEEPTPKETRRRWLAGELDRILPTADSLIEGLKLSVRYKGVTHETLSEPSFLEALRKAFPGEPWDKPMDEYMAARERPL